MFINKRTRSDSSWLSHQLVWETQSREKGKQKHESSAELGGSLNVWERAALQRVAGEQSRCCHPSWSHCLRLVHCLTLLSLAGLQLHSRSAPLGQQCRHRTRPSTWCLWCPKQQTFQQVCNRFGTSVESRGVAKLCIIETGAAACGAYLTCRWLAGSTRSQ